MPIATDALIPPLAAEGTVGSKLRSDTPIGRIVVIRMHAFGDAVITLPVAAGLRRAMPDAQIEMVTAAGFHDLFSATGLFDRVHGIRFDRSRPARIVQALGLRGSIGRPDLVLDLQRSRLSAIARRALAPPAWVAFDRFAPRSALDRSLDALRWVGLPEIEPAYGFPLPAPLVARGEEILARHGLRGEPESPIVCLNPAGCWPTKNWPVRRYIELGERMIERWGARILLIGTGNVRRQAAEIAAALPDQTVDLVGQTTVTEAMALISRIDLMVSDDSGLAHLAWVTGRPTLTLFGASRSIWSRPVGEHTAYFGSDDLPCGACMQPACARGDIFCLERRTVDDVFDACERLTGRAPGMSRR